MTKKDNSVLYIALGLITFVVFLYCIKENDTKVTPSERENLALLVCIEAGNQLQIEKVAIAAVVLNRVEDSRFPNTIDDVIYQENQFRSINNGKFEKSKDDFPEARYQEALEAVDSALAGEDPTNGALFYDKDRDSLPSSYISFGGNFVFFYEWE